MIPQLTTDLNNVQGLVDEPNDVGGLTPALLKAVYDKAGNDIKDYLNSTTPTLINKEDLTTLRKLDGNGDFTGTWNGNELVASDVGLASTVAGHTSQLAESVQQTKADVDYYVATTGSDTTGTGTSGLPFKTIQYAIDKLPQIINHTVRIFVAVGTYNETVIISGFGGRGAITLTGDSTTSTTRNVNAIKILYCSCKITCSGFNLTTTNADCVSIIGCIYCYLSRLNMVGSATTFDGVYVESSLCNIYTCTTSNRRTSVEAEYMATVFTFNLTGSLNTYGLYSQSASTIAKYGTQATATTVEVTTSGGVIR